MAKSLFSKVYKPDKGDEELVKPFMVERIEDPFALTEEEGGGSLGLNGGRVPKIERMAYERGFSSGEQAGLEMGQKKLDILLNRFSDILKELTVLRENVLLSVDENVLELAIAIARKVIHHEVRTEREVVVSVVKAALKAAILSERITIKLNPLDLDVAVENKADLMEHVDGSPKVRLEEDARVEQGGCIIETAYGNIDARLDEQMTEIQKVLEKGLNVESETKRVID